MADWTGQTFDSYEVLEQIGQGAMGPVYKARDKRLERFVALRVPPPHLVGNAHFLERFRREAAAGTKFTHKNLVQIYDIGAYHRMPYVVVELIEGESLAARLARKGKLAPADALAIILYVAKALGAAWNEARLTHLSLKPSSLLVARDGEIKLSDLGFARHAQLDDEELPAPDTEAARFASPEVARGEKHLDLRADIYSLGCILFHTITGQLHVLGTPFKAELLPPDSPPGLAKLLGSMLAADPDQRPDDYNTLLMELWQLDQHLMATDAPPPLPAAPRRRRRLWPRYVIAALVLLLFGGWLTWAALKVKQLIAQHLGPATVVPTNAAPQPVTTNRVVKPLPLPPPSRPTLPYAKWQDTVNLLALLEPKRDAVTGLWTLENGALHGTVAKKQRTARIEIPYEPPAEYDFRVEFTPQEAVGGGQYLTAFSHDFAWDFFAGPKGRACGFELVDDAPLLQNSSCVMLAPVVAGRRYVSLVEVRRGNVRGFLDDQLVTERKTDYRDMSVPPYWKLHHDFRLGLGCSGRITFHRAELRGIGGRGRSAVPVATPPPPPSAPALSSEFMSEVAALPPDWQVERVIMELEKLNPGYDKQERHEIENGKVVMLALDSPALTRIGPVRALTTLQSFRVGSSDDPKGPRYRLADLGPLRGLPLTSVICNRTAVTDLSPLRGMALTSLKLSGSPVTSLQPLRDMALLELDCRKTAVTDLSPLRKMPLRYLYCDLTVATNGPNRGVIRSLDKLKEINGVTPDSFWKQPCDYTPPTGAPVIRRD
jgi:serine/threonine protein kinase